MLTPTFSCIQDEKFVVVTIFLSAICKARDSVFDICGKQFTFYCSPYYLRLRFNQSLCEGCGERATFDVEKEQLVVFLPKAFPGEEFHHLDNPSYLLATEKQQKKMKRLISAINEDNVSKKGENEEDSRSSSEDSSEEVDFVQSTEAMLSTVSQKEDSRVDDKCQKSSLNVIAKQDSKLATYGFANAFSGLFGRLDPDLVAEIIEVPCPDFCSPSERRAMRIKQENADFSLEELILSTEEEEQISSLLHYVPLHMRDFQQALSMQVNASSQIKEGSGVEEGIEDAAARPHLAAEALEEEEEKEFVGEQGGEIWKGNVLDFSSPLASEEANTVSFSPFSFPSGTSIPGALEPSSVFSNASAPPPHQGLQESRLIVEIHPSSEVPSVPISMLAVPRNKPVLEFSREEIQAMMVAKLPPLLTAPSKLHALCLTVDILLAEAYDDLFTEGNGCCESVWNVCKLSPSLSFLDVPGTLYESCYFFARRMYTYPLYRHARVLSKVLAMVGTRMMLGSRYVIRALLRVRQLLSHSNHKHIFCTIFLDPLVAYWANTKEGDEVLLQAAKELHEHSTRKTSVIAKKQWSPPSLEGFRETLTSTNLLNRNVVLKALHLVNLDFPVDDDTEYA